MSTYKGGNQIPWNEAIPLAGIGTQIHEDNESDLKHLLLILEDLMKRTTFPNPEISSGLGHQLKTPAGEPLSSFTGVMELSTSTITNISRELTCKLGENEDEKASKIAKELSNYSWKTKAALAFAAFSIKYGKLRLLALHFEHPLARSVAFLRQQPDVPECPPNLKSWFKALAKLIFEMLELTKCVVDFREPVQSVNPEIPVAVYWIIYSVVICSSQIMSVLVMRHKILAPYEWNLDDLTKKLKSILEGLSKQSQARMQPQAPMQQKSPMQPQASMQPQTPMQPKGPMQPQASMQPRAPVQPQAPIQGYTAEEGVQQAEPTGQARLPERTICLPWFQNMCFQGNPSVHSDRHAMAYQRIHSNPEIHFQSSTVEDETMYAEAYEQLRRLFDTSSHSDSMDILKALVDCEEEPLLDGSSKERVSMDALKSKMVLLFISDLDLCHEELASFNEVFSESRTHPKRPKNQYEIVWLPVVDTSMSWKEKRHYLETIQSRIPWYSIYYPSLISPAAIKYFKEVWKFNGKPLIVVLNSDGKVVNQNAVHMIRIWGSQAFPFTRSREEMLWKTQPCGIDFLVGSIDPILTNWISEHKYICLYGGDDLDWIEKFTSAAVKVASLADNIPLQLIYMGRSSSANMSQDNISHVIQDLNLMKFFWLRLESIVESRLSIDLAENALLTRELKTLLSFNKNEKSWALISRKESSIMYIANGSDVLKSLMEYNEWKDNAARVGFLPALSTYLHELQVPQKSKLPKQTSVLAKTHNRRSSNFLWRSLSYFADPQKRKKK